MQLQHVIKLELSSQLIGQFGHVTASAQGGLDKKLLLSQQF